MHWYVFNYSREQRCEHEKKDLRVLRTSSASPPPFSLFVRSSDLESEDSFVPLNCEVLKEGEQDERVDQLESRPTPLMIPLPSLLWRFCPQWDWKNSKVYALLREKRKFIEVGRLSQITNHLSHRPYLQKKDAARNCSLHPHQDFVSLIEVLKEPLEKKGKTDLYPILIYWPIAVV